MLKALQNPLDIELTKGFYASEGIPEDVVKSAGFMDEAQAFVDNGLARWDSHPTHRFVLKTVGNGLWLQVREKEQLQ